MDSNIKKLFERYQSGRASTDERRLVEEWFAEYDINQSQINPDDLIFTRTDERIDKILHSNRKPPRLIYWVPAAAIVIVATSLFLFKAIRQNKKPVANNYIVLSAPRGTKKQFKLSDGTSIHLNAGSQVRIPYDYDVSSREIILDGEGYFDVKHDAQKPFSIRSGNLHISDIGTSFDVKAYSDESQITVVVETGIVSVERNKQILAAALTSNMQLQYNGATGSHTVSNVNFENTLAWQQNILRFDNASFPEMARSIGRWYNVDVKLSDYNTAYHHYTISFKNEPLSQVLKVLSHLTGATYRINQQNISIYLKNCKKT